MGNLETPERDVFLHKTSTQPVRCTLKALMSTPWNKKQGYGLATDPADSTEGQFDTTGFLADFKWLPGFPPGIF